MVGDYSANHIVYIGISLMAMYVIITSIAWLLYVYYGRLAAFTMVYIYNVGIFYEDKSLVRR